MPYLRCDSCGVLSYASRTASVVICPECGLPVTQPDETRASHDRYLDELMRMTRELLDADVAVLTSIRDGREFAERAAGDWPPLGSLTGGSLPLDQTYCQRMLDGRIGNYVRDAAHDERVCDLQMTRQLGVGSWMGVPIRLSDMRLYVLCCLAREARPSLGDRELRLLAGLSESIKAVLEPR